MRPEAVVAVLMSWTFFIRGGSASRCGPSDPLSSELFPWLVSVQSHGSHIAGGAIISGFWIVTAPSAVPLRQDLSVLVGSTELGRLYPLRRTSYAIKKVIIHEEFNITYLRNDLMLLLTRDKITFGRGVQPICFTNLDLHLTALKNCVVSGWTDPKDAGRSFSTSWCRLSVDNMNPCPLQKTESTECCIHRGLHGPGCWCVRFLFRGLLVARWHAG
ncbi:inactive serine protease 54 isoform 2-T2 [Anomaloglossus baeobatrachus]